MRHGRAVDSEIIHSRSINRRKKSIGGVSEQAAHVRPADQVWKRAGKRSAQNTRPNGNCIPKAWEQHSQALGTTFPAAGNSRPDRSDTTLHGNQGNTGDRPAGYLLTDESIPEDGTYSLDKTEKSKEENVKMAFSSLLFPYQEVRISSQIMSLVPVPTDCTGNVTRPKRPKECRIPYRRERCPRLSARQTVRRTDEGCPSLPVLPHALLTQPYWSCVNVRVNTG